MRSWSHGRGDRAEPGQAGGAGSSWGLEKIGFFRSKSGGVGFWGKKLPLDVSRSFLCLGSVFGSQYYWSLVVLLPGLDDGVFGLMLSFAFFWIRNEFESD